MHRSFPSAAGAMQGAEVRLTWGPGTRRSRCLHRLEDRLSSSRTVKGSGYGRRLHASRVCPHWDSTARIQSTTLDVPLLTWTRCPGGLCGTNFETGLLVIDKVASAPTTNKPVLTDVASVDDLMRALEPIRGIRPQVSGAPAELESAQPGGAQVA
jgi:hypothetical protein